MERALNNTRRSLTPLVGRIVRFYRELIDTYAVNTLGEPFDLSPWKARLTTIETERDRQRYAGTLPCWPRPRSLLRLLTVRKRSCR
jgi:hypothetical protein